MQNNNISFHRGLLSMDQTNRENNYTEYAIEWMQRHETPLPPDQQMTLESIPSYLNKKMGEKNLSTAQLFEVASTERSTGYKIMNGQLLPSRDSLLRVSFALELDVNETQYLLKIGRRARLTPRDSRDAVILHCIIKQISLIDANITLFEAGEEPL